jgi:hypothetical protein
MIFGSSNLNLPYGLGAIRCKSGVVMAEKKKVEKEEKEGKKRKKKKKKTKKGK